MKRKWFKKALSAVLSAAMCFTTMMSISTPVLAATQVDAYMIIIPEMEMPTILPPLGGIQLRS